MKKVLLLSSVVVAHSFCAINDVEIYKEYQNKTLIQKATIRQQWKENNQNQYQNRVVNVMNNCVNRRYCTFILSSPEKLREIPKNNTLNLTFSQPMNTAASRLIQEDHSIIEDLQNDYLVDLQKKERIKCGKGVLFAGLVGCVGYGLYKSGYLPSVTMPKIKVSSWFPSLGNINLSGRR